MESKKIFPLNKCNAFIGAIIQKLNGLNRSTEKFYTHLFSLFMRIAGRYNFLTMSLYGGFNEKTYRNHFRKGFDFMGFNTELIQMSCSKNLIVAFDPTYIPKSGKHTPHKGLFWSGSEGKAKEGLEIGSLAVIDLDNHTALSLDAVQTPSHKELVAKDKTLIDHYAEIIVERVCAIRYFSPYTVCDGYFGKRKFIDPICEANLHVLGKLRDDANLMYIYTGERTKERGRPKEYAGKVDVSRINKREIKKVSKNNDEAIYEGIVYAPSLKRKIKICYVEELKTGKPTGKYAILFCTDLSSDALFIYDAYTSRYQIEFLFRDAKQFAGLTHCQARNEKMLYVHFNASLTTVSLAKAAYYLPVPKDKRGAFSMSDIKAFHHNKFIVERIFSMLEIDMTNKKMSKVYRQALFYGRKVA